MNIETTSELVASYVPPRYLFLNASIPGPFCVSLYVFFQYFQYRFFRYFFWHFILNLLSLAPLSRLPSSLPRYFLRFILQTPSVTSSGTSAGTFFHTSFGTFSGISSHFSSGTSYGTSSGTSPDTSSNVSCATPLISLSIGENRLRFLPRFHFISIHLDKSSLIDNYCSFLLALTFPPARSSNEANSLHSPVSRGS